jgi:transcription elongation factor GreA
VDEARVTDERTGEMGEIMLTTDGLERLREDLVRLRGERERIWERLGLAVEHGRAAPENGDYLDAVREQHLLERRIARLEERLQAAEVVEPKPDGTLDIGERVTVLDLRTAATTDYRLVGSGEGDPAAGAVSHDSPVGARLLGRRVGDVVEVEAPGGIVRLEVVEIDG